MSDVLCVLQMYSMPVYDMIEASFRQWGLTRNKLVTRLFMRSLYVVFTCFVAVSLPFFGGKSHVNLPDICYMQDQCRLWRNCSCAVTSLLLQQQ